MFEELFIVYNLQSTFLKHTIFAELYTNKVSYINWQITFTLGDLLCFYIKMFTTVSAATSVMMSRRLIMSLIVLIYSLAVFSSIQYTLRSINERNGA